MPVALSEIKSIYFHIPFCLSKCKYCDFFSIPCADKNNPVSDDYISALLHELAFKIKKYNISSINTVYIGGGTPSLLTQNQLNTILSFLQNNLAFEKDYEFTIEMNPDDISEELIDFLQNSIITRISCGIQSLNDKVLKKVNRRAGWKENIAALEILSKKWHKTLSLDLISALPEETTDVFLHNLERIIKYNPHHISMYSLTIEEETALGQELEQQLFEYDFDYADDMWLKGKLLLEEKGYRQYEISNFCKENYECKHNLTYWNHESYLGIGAGAAESIYKKDGTIERFSNKNQIENYINFWNKNGDNLKNITEKELVDTETSKFEFFMMGLRKASGISDLQYKICFNENIPDKVIDKFLLWQEKGLVDIKTDNAETYYSLNKKGLLFLNKFLQELEI